MGTLDVLSLMLNFGIFLITLLTYISHMKMKE